METEKVLWVVNYESLEWFVEQATQAKATAVAIRTDNDLIKAIPAFKDHGMKVYGWRWPSAKRDTAMREADKVVGLLDKGLDGYFVDPEGDAGKPWDWDQKGLDGLAEDFCSAITSVSGGKLFGTTSHYRCNRCFGRLPWTSFFKYSKIFLPQAYWRSSSGVIGHGIPDDNYRVSIDCWTKAGAPGDSIAPMAGELAQVTAAEINAYLREAKAQGISSLHFYTCEESVKPAVLEAIARA